MSGPLTDGLLGPGLTLAVLGWLVPKLLSFVLPEGVKPLLLNALLSTFVMFVLSGLVFAGLYLWQGAPMAQFWEAGLASNIAFFGRLGLSSALIWAPIMIFSLMGLPRHWKEAVW